MNILLSTDNNYVMPTGVLMHSIGMNGNKDVSYHVLVNPQFSVDSREALKKVAEKYNSTIVFYIITDEVTRDLPFGKDNMPSHVSIATYYRLLITKVLPSDIDKIIYLDGDMIVRKPLDDLWNIDLTGKAIGAVHDMDEKRHTQPSRLPYPSDKGYFNAGMLLINIDYWRKNNCISAFMSFIKEHSDVIVYHDQDVLNAVLYDAVMWVPLTYNFQSAFLYANGPKDYFDFMDDEIEYTKRDACIIHFSTPWKPWSLNCFNPYTAAWRFYCSKSQWNKIRLLEDTPRNLRQYIRNFFVRNLLWVSGNQYLKFKINR